MSARDRFGPALVGFASAVLGVVVVGLLLGVPLPSLLGLGVVLGLLFAAGTLLVGVVGAR